MCSFCPNRPHPPTAGGLFRSQYCRGISQGVARVIADALIKGKKPEAPLYVAGGGCVHRRVLSSLKELLRIEVKAVPKGEIITAEGAALLASREASLDELFPLRFKDEARKRPLNPPLRIEKSSLPRQEKIKNLEGRRN